MLLLAAGAALLTPLTTYPFGRDQGVFGCVADVIARGGVPYRDAWDMKPPGIFYLFWASFALFGRSMLAPRILDLLWTLATAIAIWSLGRRLLSSWAGIAAGYLFLVRYVGNRLFWHTTQCDGFASLPLALAAIIFLRAEAGRSALLAAICGVFVALAMSLKFTLGIFLLLPCIAALLSREEPLRSRLLRCGSYVVGCCLALGLVAAFMWRAGALHDMVEIVFVWNSKYAALHVPAPLQRSLLQELGKFLIGVPNAYLFPIGLLALVGLADLGLRKDAGRVRWFIPAWAVALAASVWVQGRYYPYHWLPVLPPLALLAGQGLRTIGFLLHRGATRRAARALSAAGLVALVALLTFAYWRFLNRPVRHVLGRVPRDVYLRGFDRRLSSDFSLTADLRVAAWLRDHTEEETPVFIWGFEPLVYFLADRPPASRFLYTVPLIAEWSPPEWRQELVRDLRRRRPPYVLVVHNDVTPWMTGSWKDSAGELAGYPELDRLLDHEYRLCHQIEDFDIWERTPASGLGAGVETEPADSSDVPPAQSPR